MLRFFQVTLDAIVIVSTAWLYWLMPTLTRRDVFFGVTVAPNTRQTPAGRAIIRRYRIEVVGLLVLFALALALLAVFAPDSWWANGWSSLVVLTPVLLLAVPYLLAHVASRNLTAAPQAMGEEPSPASEPVAELRPRHYGSYVPWAWESLPLAIIAATAIYLAISYAAAPAIIPIHFDAAGTPNGYATKTIGSYFALVWSQLGLEVLLTGLALLLVGAKALPGRAESRFRKWWLRYLFAMKALLMAFLGGLAVLIANAEQTGSSSQIILVLPLSLVLVGVLLVSALVLAVRTGQGGSRLGSPTETAVDRMDDRYWKLGALYVNPSDPSMFVERRFGVGWTVNLGNPKGLLLLLALIAVAVLTPLLVVLLNAEKR